MDFNIPSNEIDEYESQVKQGIFKDYEQFKPEIEPIKGYICSECSFKSFNYSLFLNHTRIHHPTYFNIVFSEWVNDVATIEPEHQEEPKKAGRPKKGKSEEAEDGYLDDDGKKEYRMKTKKSADYTGQEMHVAERLINSGFAKDFSDLQRKSMQLTYSIMKDVGGAQMMFNQNNGQEVDVAKELEKLQGFQPYFNWL